MWWDIVTSGLGGRYIYFQHNVTSGDIADNIIEQLDLGNMGIAAAVWLLCALELRYDVSHK